jgi:hypothetical protein
MGFPVLHLSVPQFCRVFIGRLRADLVVDGAGSFDSVPPVGLDPSRIEVAPHAMNVIRTILSVVVLDQKRSALHPIIVALALVQPAHPGEFDLIKTRPANLIQPLAGLRARLCPKVLFD